MVLKQNAHPYLPARSHSTSNVAAHQLKNRETWGHKPSHATVLTVTQGTAYVTVSGDPVDHFVRAGESLSIPGRKLMVAQGYPDAQFAIQS